jgi:hypothetical protein
VIAPSILQRAASMAARCRLGPGLTSVHEAVKARHAAAVPLVLAPQHRYSGANQILSLCSTRPAATTAMCETMFAAGGVECCRDAQVFYDHSSPCQNTECGCASLVK